MHTVLPVRSTDARPPFRKLLASTALLFASLAAHAADPKPVTIFAAASLKGSLDTVAAEYANAGHTAPSISYAGTSALARQVEQGAPADVFLSADTEWMDTLQKGGHIDAGTRHDLLGNALVLIAPKDSKADATLTDAASWSAALGDGRLAVARVDSVPAGKYAKAALTHLGVWSGLEAHLAQTDDVRQALMLVARGEAPLGIVYRTDAQAEPAVRVVATFPADSHAPIVYPVAAVKRDGANAESAAFLAFLRSDAAAAIFRRNGFDLLP